MAVGFFVLPRVGSGAEDDPYRPKYVTTGPPDFQKVPELNRYEASEEMERPQGSGNWWFAVRLNADDPATFTTLEGQSDAYRVDPSSVIAALNSTGIFPVDLNAKEWAFILHHFVRRPPIVDVEP